MSRNTLAHLHVARFSGRYVNDDFTIARLRQRFRQIQSEPCLAGARRAQHQMSRRFHVVTPLAADLTSTSSILSRVIQRAHSVTRAARRHRQPICNAGSTHARNHKARWADSKRSRFASGSRFESERPRFVQPRIMVFAADHGVAPAGVSAFPQEVTAQMVMNYLSGGAAINVLARQLGLALAVIDAGVASPLAPTPGLIDRNLGRGTRNYLQEPAMTPEQRDRAIAMRTRARCRCH